MSVSKEDQNTFEINQGIKPEPEGPFTVFEVLSAELARLRGPVTTPPLANGDLTKLFGTLSEARLKAISLSGGGIRSATFALGVIQSLASRGLLDKFDYLSTVSGGGYLGSWLSAWIRVEMLNEMGARAQDKFKAKTDEALLKKYKAAKEKALSENLPEPSEADYRLTPDQYKIEEQQFVLDALKTELFDIKGVSEKGIEIVQESLAKGEWATIENGDYCDRSGSPNGSQPPSNPEPRPVRHLREYSNYMTPKVGIFSADTWALFGIYLRNLFLNWTIFVPLIAAILLLPAIALGLFLLLTKSPRVTGHNDLLLIVGMAAGAFSLTYVASKLPSKNPPGQTPTFSGDKWVLCFGVLPQFILAFCSTTFWWNLVQPIATPEGADAIAIARPYLLEAVGFSMIIFLAGYLIFVIISAVKSIWVPEPFSSALVAALNLRSAVFGLIAAFAGGLLLRIVFQNIFAGLDWINFDPPPHSTTFFCIAVPIFLLSTLAQLALFVGLASGETTDGDREWVARYGGWILLAGLGWLFLNIGVLLWPIIIEKLRFHEYLTLAWASLGSLITLVSGIISLVGGFSSKFPVRKNPDGSRKFRLISAIPQVASGVFLCAILVGISFVITNILAYVSASYSGEAIWLPGTQDTNAIAGDISFLSPWFLLPIALGLIIVGSFVALFVNVNRFSLHGAYRDRLVRAYLGASNLFRKPNPFTGFDDNDNRQLHRLKRQKPFHVLAGTLNLVASQNLAWQNRKATSFVMTPLHCGSEALGYRATNQFSRNATLPKCSHLRYCNRLETNCGNVENCQYPGKSLRLGTAMAISGAAADPNMGYYSSALVTFIMSLFNIRLGWWLGNTGCRGSEGAVSKRAEWFFRHVLGFEQKEYYKRTDPTFAVFPLINETLGRTSEERRYLNITDGGHFENLALYEMIRRRCRLIVLSDAAADAGFTFGELANAIEKCKVDLGVEILVPPEIGIYSRDASKRKKRSGKRYFIAQIIYPEQEGTDAEGKSWLLYCRPTLYGNEPVDIQHYAATNQAYPHQSTGDQFFDERQFEAYRRLGRFTMDEILGDYRVVEVFRSIGLNSQP